MPKKSAADATEASKASRKQLLLSLRPETILQLKSEALHSNRHAYEIVQDLLDAHFERKKVEEAE